VPLLTTGAGGYASAAVGSPVFRAASVDGSATSVGSYNPSIPSGTVDGDTMYAVLVTGSGNGPTPPSGFILQNSDTTGSVGIWLYKKTAASEGSSYTFSLSTNGAGSVIIASYSGGNGLISASDFSASTASSTLVAPSITPANSGILLCTYQQTGSRSLTSAPSGMTQRLGSGSPLQYLYELDPSASGATGTKSLSYNNTTSCRASSVQIY